MEKEYQDFTFNYL